MQGSIFYCKEMRKLTNLQKKVWRKQGLCQRKQELSQYRMSKPPATGSELKQNLACYKKIYLLAKMKINLIFFENQKGYSIDIFLSKREGCENA